MCDRPGGIAELTTLIAQSGASIKDMYQGRFWTKNDIFTVCVKVRDYLNDIAGGDRNP